MTPTEPNAKMRALRGSAQAIVGMLFALLAVAGFEVPAEQAVPITAGIVALVGVMQNAYEARR